MRVRNAVISNSIAVVYIYNIIYYTYIIGYRRKSIGIRKGVRGEVRESESEREGKRRTTTAATATKRPRISGYGPEPKPGRRGGGCN